VAGNGGAAGRAKWRLTGGGGAARRCVRRRGVDGRAGGEVNRREVRPLSGNGGAEVGDAGDGAWWWSGGFARERRSAWVRR
jgi:hypothetical protein